MMHARKESQADDVSLIVKLRSLATNEYSSQSSLKKIEQYLSAYLGASDNSGSISDKLQLSTKNLLSICDEFGTVEEVAEKVVDKIISLSAETVHIVRIEAERALADKFALQDTYIVTEPVATEQTETTTSELAQKLDEHGEPVSMELLVDTASNLYLFKTVETVAQEEAQIKMVESQTLKSETISIGTLKRGTVASYVERATKLIETKKKKYVGFHDTYGEYLKEIGAWVGEDIKDTDSSIVLDMDELKLRAVEFVQKEETLTEPNFPESKYQYALVPKEESALRTEEMSVSFKMRPSGEDDFEQRISNIIFLPDVTKTPGAEWPTIGEFTIDLGQNALLDHINGWYYSDDWKYSIHYLTANSDATTDNHFYEVIWSIPSRIYPIAQATASIYFTITVSRIKPKSCKCEVTFQFEGSHFIHQAGEFKFMEHWLYNIIDAKLSLYKRLLF